MNNILSIDLDILFSPYVGIYDKFIFDNKPCEYLWNQIKSFHNPLDFKINTYYFKYIENIFNNYKKQIPIIYIGNDHSSILNAIEEEKENLEYPYKFNIYNIDYHHDIVYTEAQRTDILEYNMTTCGNWVGYLNYNKLINQYYWYRGQGSEFNQDICNYPLIMPNNIKISLFNNNFPLDLNIDLFFISISPQWIPTQYYDQIKNLLLKLFDKKIKHFKYPFFVNEGKPNFLSIKGDKINNYFNF